MQKLNCILLIDDDDINNYMNERLIKKLNVSHNVKVTLNGKEGLEFIKHHCSLNDDKCPELIFLDINMPVMDGFEFLQAFEGLNLENRERMNINILTSSHNEKDIAMLKVLGKFNFINKPLTEEKLFNCLINALSQN